MKLSTPPSSTSFYESFSDLIFGTMAIFLLLFILMMTQVNSETMSQEEITQLQQQIESQKKELAQAKQNVEQTRESEQELKQQLSEIQQARESKGRFTGGADETNSYIAHVLVGGTPSVVLFPSTLAGALQVRRSFDGNDPLLKLCELATSPDGLTVLSIDDYVRMAGGVSQSFTNGIIVLGDNGTMEAGLLLAAREKQGLRLDSLSPTELRRRVFGENLSILDENQSLRLAQPWRSYHATHREWLGSMAADRDFHSWGKFSQLKIRDLAKDDPPGTARLQFTSVGSNKIRVGHTELTSAQFRGLLRSLKPGNRFYLEYLDDGAKEAKPPEWVVREILVPTGFFVQL